MIYGSFADSLILKGFSAGNLKLLVNLKTYKNIYNTYKSLKDLDKVI